jgi:hypothetical protein
VVIRYELASVARCSRREQAAALSLAPRQGFGEDLGTHRLAEVVIVGRTLRIDGQPHEVVGVLPESFNDWRHFGNIDFFRPFAFPPEAAADRRTTPLIVIGRRAPGVSYQAGAGFVASIGARLAREFPDP